MIKLMNDTLTYLSGPSFVDTSNARFSIQLDETIEYSLVKELRVVGISNIMMRIIGGLLILSL